MIYARQPSILSHSPITGTEPQTTGPLPVSSPSGTAARTAAPAPSPNSTQVERSDQSVRSVSFSEPITIALRAEPARIAWSAIAVAYEEPEQAVFTSTA